MHHFPLMARFNEWANARLYGAVERLSDENYRLDRGLFFGSIHRTLNHLMVVDRLWTRRIDGEPHGIVSLDMQLYEDFAELSDARVQEDRRLIRQVDGLDEERLGQPVRYRRIIGSGEAETRCSHILLTLFNHQTHHRGQITAALTQSGIEPPPLDIVYFLEERPETARL
ncbi:MAG TPA: DinB family protein [Alphaproteobacteria bacterium]|nr:DinB family protein [Alphaproteobacteria bacterium]